MTENLSVWKTWQNLISSMWSFAGKLCSIETPKKMPKSRIPQNISPLRHYTLNLLVNLLFFSRQLRYRIGILLKMVFYGYFTLQISLLYPYHVFILRQNLRVTPDLPVPSRPFWSHPREQTWTSCIVAPGRLFLAYSFPIWWESHQKIYKYIPNHQPVSIMDQLYPLVN